MVSQSLLCCLLRSVSYLFSVSGFPLFPLNVGVGLKVHVHLLRNRAFRGLREAKIEYDSTGTLATVVPVISSCCNILPYKIQKRDEFVHSASSYFTGTTGS